MALVAVVLVIVVVGSAFIPAFTPKTYSTHAVIKIGNIQDKPLEYPDDICALFGYKPNMMSLIRAGERGITQEELANVELSTRGAREIVFISNSGNDPVRVAGTLQAVVDSILERHRQMYTRLATETQEQLKRIDGLEESVMQKIGESGTVDGVISKISLYQALADLNNHRLNLYSHVRAPTTVILGPTAPVVAPDGARLTFTVALLAMAGALTLAWAIRLLKNKPAPAAP